MKDKVLVVEDSPTERDLMIKALEPNRYQVSAAADGEEALVKAETEKPDLILLDVVLPKKNGFQVCRQLKTSPATRDIKIILVTSKTQDSDRFWGLKQGADEYLTKPFETEELDRLLERHL